MTTNRMRSWFDAILGCLILGLGVWAMSAAPGCAALVGGAAGAGTGYIAGHEAAKNEEEKHH